MCSIWSDQIKKRWAGNTARIGERRAAYRILVRKPYGEHLENTGMDRGMILKWIFNKLLRDVNGIDLAQDTYSWWPVVHAETNIWIP